MSNAYPQVASRKEDLALVQKCSAECKFGAAHVPVFSRSLASACSGLCCTLSEAAAFGLDLGLCSALTLNLPDSYC